MALSWTHRFDDKQLLFKSELGVVFPLLNIEQ